MSAASVASVSAPTQPGLHVEESHALPLVSITLALRSGAASDPPGKDGLTRVLGRMLRRGCRGMTAQEIEERIDALGAELGTDASSSVISVHGDVISRSLDAFVDLFAKLLAEPTFDEAELGRLLRESEGELIEGRDSDRSLVTRGFRRTLFEGHPYGRRISGQIATLRTITRDDVVRHYQRHFVRGNVVVGFAGDVTPERASELALRLVAGLPEGATTKDGIEEPTQRAGRRLVFVDKPERTQTQILIGGLGSHPRDADHVALHVATTVFGGTFTSRLMRAVRSERGWSYGAYARLPYDLRRDAFSMWTFPAAKDAAACIALELELLHAWRERGIGKGELSFAKRYITRSHAFELDTAPKRLHQKLDTDLFELPADYHATFTDRVQEVTLEAANEAVRRRISEDDLVVSVVGTHADIGEAIAKAVPGLGEAQVVAYDLE